MLICHMASLHCAFDVRITWLVDDATVDGRALEACSRRLVVAQWQCRSVAVDYICQQAQTRFKRRSVLIASFDPFGRS